MNIEEAYACLSNIYVNFSKVNACYYVYSYRPEYDPNTKKTLKRDIVSIGKIFNDSGIGEIIFNSKFLNSHPLFINLTVLRTGKNKLHIELKEQKKETQKDSDSILMAKHMKIGATYCINEVLKKSYSGRTLKFFRDTKKITQIQYQQLTSILIYAIYEGIKHLGGIEYFVRDHIVPYQKNINKDTLQRMYDVLTSEFIVGFYKKKQEIITADLSQLKSTLSDRRYIALDGTNIDVKSPNLNIADYGKSKSNNDTPIINFLSLIDHDTGTLMGHCTYSCHTNDLSTLEGAVKQLAYFGCKNYVIVVDRGYWSIYNINVMYNLNLDFIVHVKISHNAIKKFIEQNIGDLSVGNGCVKIEHNNEINYGRRFDMQWSYHDLKTHKKQRKNIYLYAFYNPELAAKAKSDLEDKVRELNALYSNYLEDVIKARAEHKKKPDEPALSDYFKELINNDILFFNTKYNRFDLNDVKAYKYCQTGGVWIIASSQKVDCEKIFSLYRQRNEIEVMYRYFKNHVEADTLKVSSEDHFDAKLFIGLLASEFLNSVKLKINKWNETATQKEKVQLKDNSFYMTFKDLDTLECIYHDKTIIPTTNILKRQENLFKAMDIEPIVLQNTKLKKATFNEDLGLIVN